MEDEFRKLLIEIKPFYHGIPNQQEKLKVGRLIKELVNLSTTEFQRSQRNELAKALLFKLRTNQLSQTPFNEYVEVTTKIQQAKANHKEMTNNAQKSIPNMEDLRKSSHLNDYASASKQLPNSRTQHWKTRPLSRKLKNLSKRKRKHQREKNLRQESDSARFSILNSLSEYSQTDLTSNTETGNGSESELNFDEEDENFNGSRDITKPRLKQEAQKIKRLIQPITNATKIPQETHAMEAELHEKLVQVRRESELQVASLVSRKNAEIEAIQQAAEAKHGELRRAIDNLEAQLTAAVQNADAVRKQSEDRSRELQTSLTTQMETLVQNTAEERQKLMREHEAQLMSLQDQLNASERKLEEKLKLADDLQKGLEEKAHQCIELEKKCSDLKASLDNAQNQQQEVEVKLKEQYILTEELNSTVASLKNANRSYETSIAEHDKELQELRAQNANEVVQIKLEYTETISRLNIAIERLKNQFEEQLNLRENKASVEERNRLSSEVTDLQAQLENAKNTCKVIEQTWQERNEQLRRQNEDSISRLVQREQELLTEKKLLSEKLNRLEAKACLIHLDAQTQSEQGVDDELLMRKIGDTFVKQMKSWHEDSLAQWAEQVRDEERQRLQTVFAETEETLKQQHEESLSMVKTEYTNRYNQLKKREELLRTHCTRLETELAECKKTLQREVETRRQQLNELSVAREKERQEWSMMQNDKLTVLKEQYELKIQQMLVDHGKELEAKLEETMCNKERHLQEHIENLNTQLNEYTSRIEELQAALTRSGLEKDAMQQSMTSMHHEELKTMKQRHQQELWTLKEKIASERKRARTAEFKLRERDKIWTDLNKLRDNQADHFLPVEVQVHLESTIDSLRAQVELLQKRIELLTGKDVEECRQDNELMTVLHTRKKQNTHLESLDAPKSTFYSYSPRANGDDPVNHWNELQIDLTPTKGQHTRHFERITELPDRKPVVPHRARGTVR